MTHISQSPSMVSLAYARGMRTLALLGVALFLAGCNDPRCSKKNCSVLLQACSTSVAGMPDVAGCASRTTPSLAEVNAFDSAAACEQACNVSGDGELVACGGQLEAQCRASPVNPELVLTRECVINAPQRAAACVQRCGTGRTSCEDKCPSRATSGTYTACMNCSTLCGIEEARCLSACPRS